MPRSFSSGALSISSYFFTVAMPFSAATRVIVDVSVVLPWSTWPIVPTLTCGFLRSNFALAMMSPECLVGLAALFGDDLVADVLGDLFVVRELHAVGGASLGHGAQGRGVAEHLGQGHLGPDDLGVAALLHAFHPAALGIQVADHVAHEVLG